MVDFVPMIPISARTSKGVVVLLSWIFELCHTTLAKKLSYSNEVQATVIEVGTILGV